ncbi:nSTAND1 domain-containing NTPase, partial [Coleofasciculus sp.]|uniref:nSTAND1 domain-containing NTPase n=1 Tax=Coleofasciculus sp. TaxID=3100458 RepID=UPI0039F974BA
MVEIKASERTLYARIQAELGDEKPDAAMVLGLEAVGNSRQLLSATNQVREEFRKHFSFPLVLWINDQGLKDFLTYAPDFESWGISSHFLMPRQELIAVLKENVDKFFAGSLRLSLDQCREIHQATQELPEADYQGNPELAATVETLRGAIQAGHPVNRNLDRALIHYQNSAALWQDCNQVERQGKLLQELAIGYSLKAASIDEIEHPDWQAARQYVQQCFAVFEAAQRPDLVANSLSSLGQILKRLGEWQELQRRTEQAVAYHKKANLSNKLAEDYGLLAQVALAQANWQKAQDLAQQALDCLAVSSRETDTPWQMAYAESQYRFTLAQAYSQLNQPQAAIENLERAQIVGSPEYNTSLYLDILSQLQQSYFQQRRYVQAFEIKLNRQSIEQQYGLRAFVGAAWIQPQREAKLAPTAGSPAYSQPGVGEMIAPEIAASGRQLDVERLIERIGRNDCKLIVIHGQSGVGKSSLVQGGLVPALKQKVMGTSDTLPITMRVYSHWQEELTQLLAEALADREADASFVGEFVGAKHLRPDVSVLCQNPNANASPNPHEEDGGEISQSPIPYLQHTERLNLRTVLIFDQFEEFFFVYPDARERRRFFEFIGQCLKISPVKVVLSLREDYLHYLLECNYLDSMKVIGNDILSRNILYRLGNFSAADTQSIIQRLTERSSFHLEAALIEALVQDLAGDVGEVRPIELQVVGAQLQTEKITRLAEYRQYGEQAKEVLVRRYLDEVVADCGEENQQAAELVLYLLTDEKGTRPLKTRAEIERDLQALAVNVRAEMGESDEVQTSPPRHEEGMVGIAHPTTGASLDLVLQIFVKSGLVLLLPENPEQRYQLVHDYFAAFIRQQQEPRLQELIAELEKERKQRRQAEAQRQLTQAELERTEQARVRLNRQVRRALAGLALTGVMAGVIVVSVSGWATYTVGDAKYQVSAAENKIKQAETKSKQAETKANQAETQVKQAQTQLGTVQTQLEKAQTKTQAAEAKQKQAEAKRQAAQKQVQLAQQQMQAANQNLKTAQAKVNQAQQQYEAANQAAETARKNVEKARREQAQLQEKVQLAETRLQDAEAAQQAAKAAQEAAQIAQKEAQEGNRLEREGTNAIKEFEYQPLNALISAMEAGQDLQKIVKNRPLKDYPATSPLLALQTIQNNIQERVHLNGHQGGVTSVNFSPDGQRIVTASDDKTARVWDIQGNQITQLKGHQSTVYSANFSPDGQRIVTASRDTTARVWDIQGNLITQLKGYLDTVTSANFSPDGQQIVTASWDKTARLWDIQGNQITELTGHQGTVYSANFSPDGQRIVTASEDNTARVWDIQGNQITELTGHQGTVYSANFSPDGQRIVTASWDKTARVWDIQGNLITELKGHQSTVRSANFSPDGQRIVTASDDKTARVWDIQGNQITELKGHQSTVRSANFSPDGQRIVT